MKSMNGLMLAVTLTTLAACGGKSGGSKSSPAVETITPTQTSAETNAEADSQTGTDAESGSDTPADSTTGNIPTQALSFQVSVKSSGLSNAQTTKLKAAVELIKRVVASDEFRTQVLNHAYNGKTTFVNNGGLTNEQIFQTILDGAEKLKPAKDNSMDLELAIYYAPGKTVSYTFNNTLKIWFNSKFFNKYAAKTVAEKIFHEWLHKLGFNHDGTTATSQKYSVPFAVGNMISEIGATYL